VAHEETLERRDALDRAEAELAGEPQRQQIVGEQAIEAVGDADQRERVEPAPALVAGERGGAARVKAEAPRVDDQLGERRDVAQRQVPALPGDRMDRARGVGPASSSAP
jgi:hypothetical protein